MQHDKTEKGQIFIYLLSFLLPAVLITAVFAGLGVFPFGEKSLLVVDLDNEYIDYLALLNQTVRSGDSLLRSWSMGMGLNMLGLIAFYISSPLNLIPVLLPVGWITEAIFLVTVLKFGLCGLFFALYSRRVFCLSAVYTLCFSTAYALMAYNIAYSSNIMWLDGVALLPLVLLGVEGVLYRDRWGVLAAALFWVFFTSYYIGYMIGLFSFLYMTARYFSLNNSLRRYLAKLGRLVGAAAVAAGCCAFLLLPAFLNLRDGQSQLFHVPFSLLLEHSMVQLGAKLLPGTYDTLMDAGLPFVYSTVLGLFLAVLYFFHRQIPRREKWIMGGVLAFLLLSFSWEFLYLAFHAFEDPTWFPARYSFVFSFMLLYLAMGVLARKEGIARGAVWGAWGGLCVLFVEIGLHRYSFVPTRSVVIGVLLAGIYALCLAGPWSGRRATALLLLALVCGETAYNAGSMVRGIDEEFQYKSRESYVAYREAYAPALALLPESGAGAYRTEIVEQRNANGAMALGYHSISHYSTTTDQALNSLLRQMAYNTGTINEVRFAPGTPLGGGLLGIRYVLSKGEMGGGYDLWGQAGTVGVYENELAFPLAYFADHSALSFQPQGSDPFALQEAWVESLWLEEREALYQPLDPGEPALIGLRATEEDGHWELVRDYGGDSSQVVWTITNPTGRPAYAYVSPHNRGFYKVYAQVGGNSAQRVLGYRNSAILPLGSGETVTLTLDVADGTARIGEVFFYTLDLDRAKAVAEQAAEGALEITCFEGTRVEGSVTAPRDGLVLTSFPFDRGWKVRVDGQAVDSKRFAGVFLAFPVSQGEHQVAMRYRPAGFLPGVGISALTLLALGLWWLRRRLLPSNRANA